MYGHYIGEVLEVNNLLHCNFEMALEEFPKLKMTLSKLPFPFNVLSKLFGEKTMNKGFIPPFFRKTMSLKDNRLDEKQIGLGVVVDGHAKHYKIEDLMTQDQFVDVFRGLELIITFDKVARTPRCVIKDSKVLPMQLYTRCMVFPIHIKIVTYTRGSLKKRIFFKQLIW